MNVRIFPVARPDQSIVVATVDYPPALLSTVLTLCAERGHPDYRAAWIVENGETEAELWVFKSIEDRTVMTRLSHCSRSGLTWREGFETTKAA